MNTTPFLILDFETLTPKGRPPEPIEVGAVMVADGIERWRFSRLIRPPSGVGFTDFDVRQTGIRPEDVQGEKPANAVLAELDAAVSAAAEDGRELVVVAHNARYEAGIIGCFAPSCPTLATVQYLDTVALAKAVLPGLVNYRLDTVADRLGVTCIGRRHRALPDAAMTSAVLLKLLDLGREKRLFDSMTDLLMLSSIRPDEIVAKKQVSLL
jgi:DNA polymerase-3 subunit epsilon